MALSDLSRQFPPLGIYIPVSHYSGFLKLLQDSWKQFDPLDWTSFSFFFYYFFYFKDFFLERRERREKEREKNINVWLSHARSILGTWPESQAHALTGNRTSNPLVCRLVLNPLSYTSQLWTSSY